MSRFKIDIDATNSGFTVLKYRGVEVGSVYQVDEESVKDDPTLVLGHWTWSNDCARHGFSFGYCDNFLDALSSAMAKAQESAAWMARVRKGERKTTVHSIPSGGQPGWRR